MEITSAIIRKLKTLYEFSILKTLRLNFAYLPPKEAIKMPIIVSRRVRLREIRGKLIFKRIKTGLVRFGFDQVGIFDSKRSRSIWEVRGTIVFQGNARFGNGVKISVLEEGNLQFGENFMITAESAIVCANKIQFGKDCLMAWDCLVMDTDFHKIIHDNSYAISKPIIIGDHVWIGCRSTVLKGSEIPSGVVVGANSVVRGKYAEENSVLSGNPAQVCSRNINWEI